MTCARGVFVHKLKGGGYWNCTMLRDIARTFSRHERNIGISKGVLAAIGASCDKYVDLFEKFEITFTCRRCGNSTIYRGTKKQIAYFNGIFFCQDCINEMIYNDENKK
jgi:predicted RNA-binding Zn-ribbon protein involved in translation (DUF1610 family)